MAKRCVQVTAKGQRCKNSVHSGCGPYCWTHWLKLPKQLPFSLRQLS